MYVIERRAGDAIEFTIGDGQAVKTVRVHVGRIGNSHTRLLVEADHQVRVRRINGLEVPLLSGAVEPDAAPAVMASDVDRVPLVPPPAAPDAAPD